MAESKKKTDKVKIQFTVSRELLEKLDAYCEKYSMSRQSYLGYLIGTSLETHEQLLEAAKKGISEGLKK